MESLTNDMPLSVLYFANEKVGRETDTYGQLALVLDSMKATYKKNLPKQKSIVANNNSVKESALKTK